jgi:hypothetical protein
MKPILLMALSMCGCFSVGFNPETAARVDRFTGQFERLNDSLDAVVEIFKPKKGEGFSVTDDEAMEIAFQEQEQPAPAPAQSIGPEWVVIFADRLARVDFRMIVNAQTEAEAGIKAYKLLLTYIQPWAESKLEYQECQPRRPK